MTFLFAFLASIGLMNAQQATLTWGLVTDLSGSSSEPEITLKEVTYGSKLTPTSIGKSYNEGKGTLFSPAATGNYTSALTDGSWTVTFTISIADGYSFKPSNVSFFSAADGSGNDHFVDVHFNNDSPFISKYKIGRGSSAAETKSVSISDIELKGENTLKFDLYGKPGGTTKGWTIGHVEIIGELVDLSDPRPKANISWNKTSTSLKIRDAFTAPAFNNPNNLPVIFSSSNEEVAVVDENGKISLIEGALGTTMISATYDGSVENAPYKTTTANTTIEVVTNVKDVNAQVGYEKVESIPLTQLYTANATSGTLAAGNLIDDDNITIKTIYSATYSSYGKEYLGNNFKGSVQLGRVKNTPSVDNPFGTEESKNSPIIVTPNVDCKVVMFIRRQTVEQEEMTTEDDDVVNNVITRTHYMGMSPNDGKGIFASPHSAIDTKLDQNLVFGAYADNTATDYLFCAVEWNMKAGETYTIWASGTTIAMNGIGYYTDYTEAPEDPITRTSWDFTKWSDATVANLKADTNWSDVEDPAKNPEPTEASKDNCFWQVSASKGLSPNKYVKANRTTIEELAGLKYLNTDNRSLAIAVNYQAPNEEEGFGPYKGRSYLWLANGNNKDYFTIPDVPAGATIKMGVESHRNTGDKKDARGIELSINGEKLLDPNGKNVDLPIEYTEQEWVVPTSAAESNEVKISRTNGCHIYFITVNPPQRQIQDYTIQYKANDKVIEGKSKTKSGFVGDPVEVTDEDKAEFSITEGNVTTTYTYSSDDSEGMTINADGNTIVTITMTATEKRVNTLYSWDFTKWSNATVTNLKAKTNWSDIESASASEPTEASKDNCFWQVSAKDINENKYVMANGAVIKELEGLVYTNTNDRSLAIALNYPETSLGTYHGPSYLWLGSNKKNYFIIPNVPAGSTIKMCVETHKIGDPRGVELSISGNKLNGLDGNPVALPTKYTEQEWFVPEDAAELNDVQIYNTNGCHIYYITVTHPELQKYTLRYVAGEETIKEVTKVGNSGSPISLTDEDKADITITANGLSTKYSYSGDNSEGKTIDADGSTVITITMLKGLSIPTGYMAIPGELSITHSSWDYQGGLKLENNDTNIGYIKNKNSATGKLYVTESGVYSMNIDFYVFKNACDMQIEITDEESGNKEVDTYYHIADKHEAKILLEGTLTEGKKTIKYTFHSESDGYLVNYRNHTITKVGETYAALKAITAEGLTKAETEGYDYTFNIPMTYEGETVALKADLLNATLSVKAGENEIEVAEDGTFKLPVPAPNEASEAELTLNLEEGAIAPQTEFKLRLFHVDGVLLTGLNIDGLIVDEETVASIQSEKKGATIDRYIFTTLPKVVASFKDGNTVEATGTLADDKASATFTFQGVAGDKTEDYSFTLTGFHIYQESEKDETEVLKYNAEYKDKGGEGIWSDGRYKITANDGWGGKQFKMKSNTPTILTAPSYLQIKQIKMACLRDNYTPGKVASVTSEGATVYLPSASEFQTGVNDEQSLNLVINVENHTPGTPFEITFEEGSQPVAWFEFIYESFYVDVTGITLKDNEGQTLDEGAEIELTGKNAEYQFSATVTPSDASEPTVEWTSDNNDVVTVDENGKVKTVGVGKAKITATAGEFSASCTVKVYPRLGDANHDDAIDINDAVDITNYVVKKKTVADEDLEFYQRGANVNEDEDGMITFADASAVAVMAAKEPVAESTQNRIRAAYDADSMDALVIGRVSASSKGSVIPVTLDNTEEYVALQADIILPEGMNVDVKAGSRIAGSHSMITWNHADNHIRVVIFNLGNNAFADNEAPIFEIVTDSYVSASDIAITSIIASDTDANGYMLASRTADTNGVAAIGLDPEAPVKVFDVNGIYVGDTMEGLKQGTYIVRQGEVAKTVRVR